MTDINEIIGRALLNVDPGYIETYRGHIVEADYADASLIIEATVKIAEVGAAVVKALGEAGYKISQKENPMAADADFVKRLGDFMALVEKNPNIGRLINRAALRKKYEEAREAFERNWPGVMLGMEE